MSDKVTAPLGDKQIIIETGKLANQADGAVTVQLGETIVIVAAVAASKAKPGQEFFPLTVDYPCFQEVGTTKCRSRRSS